MELIYPKNAAPKLIRIVIRIKTEAIFAIVLFVTASNTAPPSSGFIGSMLKRATPMQIAIVKLIACNMKFPIGSNMENFAS